MTMLMSTGAQRRVLDLGVKVAFEDCIILLFSGSPPVTPDAAVGASNVLVARAGIDPNAWVAGTLGTNGLVWDDADVTGVMRPNMTTAKAVGVTSGTARWFWLIENQLGSDTLAASLITARLQGIVAVGGGDLRVSNANFNAGSESGADSIRISFRKGVV